MNFEDFEDEWRYDTFIAAAIDSYIDFDEYLDDPETGEGEVSFDIYVDEINDYCLPF